MLTRAEIIDRAIEIAESIDDKGQLQVRYVRGRFLTYAYPRPYSSGVQGQLVGVYRSGVPFQWLQDDLIEFVSGKAKCSNDESQLLG